MRGSAWVATVTSAGGMAASVRCVRCGNGAPAGRARNIRGFELAVLLSASSCGLGLAFTDRAVAESDLSTVAAGPVLVYVDRTLDRLIAEEDTDGDKKITIEDVGAAGNGRGDGRFVLVATDGRRYEVAGTYHLSNLLQELKLGQDRGAATARIYAKAIFAGPVARISRLIRELYWNGLTRRIDEHGLARVLQDEKTQSGGFRYLYVPHGDARALEYFVEVADRRSDLRLRVVRLPARITPGYVAGLEGRHGLLSLALARSTNGRLAGLPFVVPGGRFNEMYGWDSYFEALGLLADGRVALAKAMVNHFVYQITRYGKILNANRTYYLTRSQPPFLTSMALAVHRHLPGNADSKAWLKTALAAAMVEYRGVWMNRDRLTETGLSRYHGTGKGPPPEVEPGHFDAIYGPFARARGLDTGTFERKYRAGELAVPELDRFFVHDRCVRESGHDTTFRWDWDGDRCADFVTVDLNALLYKIELDLARAVEREFGGAMTLADGAVERASDWYDRARARKKLINTYLWDERRGMYFDYDVAHRRRRAYVSATTFYPLWAASGTDPDTSLVSERQAARLIENALPLLEMPGGIAASDERSRGPLSSARPARQWDYPNGWAPHQMLMWRGLVNHGRDRIAHRLIYRWLYTITRNAVDYNGTIPEKFDVVARSHKVFAEYGNVGTEFAYITREGFGWMNASYQVGLEMLPRELRSHLDRLVPPEWIFGR